MDPTPEQQPNPSIKEIEVGDWFKPFEKYGDTPYDPPTDTDFRKSFPFILKGIGESDISLAWHEDSIEKDYGSMYPCLIIEENGEKKVQSADEIREERQKMGTHLMGIEGFVAQDTYGKIKDLRGTPGDTLFSLEIKLPSGKQISFDIHLDNDGKENWLAGVTCVYDGEEMGSVLIAEKESLLEGIETRIIKSNA